MTHQLLFDAPPPHTLPPAQSHSATSRAAAEAITPHIGKMQAAVLAYLKSCGERGSTDNELIASGVVSANGARARRIELARKGLIRQCGERDGCAIWRAV